MGESTLQVWDDLPGHLPSRQEMQVARVVWSERQVERQLGSDRRLSAATWSGGIHPACRICWRSPADSNPPSAACWCVGGITVGVY